MKKKALAIAAVITVSALFVAGGFYANSEQLQGRFSNLNITGGPKLAETEDKGPKFFDTGAFETDIDLSEGLVYFSFDNFINSSATLDLDMDEEVIIGHMVLSFTDAYFDKYEDDLIDITLQNVYAMSSDDETLVNMVTWGGADKGFGYNMVSSNTYAADGNDSWYVRDLDPSEGDFTVEFWINPSDLDYDRFDPSDVSDMYLAVRDVHARPAGDSYSYIGYYPGDNEDVRFSFADVVTATGTTTEVFRSLMTFSF